LYFTLKSFSIKGHLSPLAIAANVAQGANILRFFAKMFKTHTRILEQEGSAHFIHPVFAILDSIETC